MNRRVTDAVAALRAMVARPEAVARFALYVERDSGEGLAWLLRRQLSSGARRRLAARLLSDDDVLLVFSAGGFDWSVPTGDEVTAELLAVGEYTASEVEILIAWLRARYGSMGDSVVDIGANVGSTTLPLARAGLRVLAIEPVPATFAFLEENVERNGLSAKVKCVLAAVSSEAAALVMSVPKARAASRVVGRSSDRKPEGSEIVVDAEPLDVLVRNAGLRPEDLAFVWCDAEGHETEVARGGRTLWAAGTPLYTECGPAGDAASAFAEEALRDFREFVTEHDLASLGVGALPCPISEFPNYLASRDRLVNVLLLPDRRATSS